MIVQLTCTECGSGVEFTPEQSANKVECSVCGTVHDINVSRELEDEILKECPCCGRKDFYKQKDFNRKIGVLLFVVAAILSIWTYGISLIVAWLIDLFLFKKVGWIGICYKCDTIFRTPKNIGDLTDFNHEMNDRIKYADHDFHGEPLEH